MDVKDDGVNEFGEYLDQHGTINTLIVKTPSGGYHYYFNYVTSNPEDQQLIEQYLKTATKYRGKGIDIRSDGGYVVGPPSTRDGVSYNVVNASAPLDMPTNLIRWLREGRLHQPKQPAPLDIQLMPNTFTR